MTLAAIITVCMVGATSTVSDCSESFLDAVLAPVVMDRLEQFMAAPTVYAELSQTALGMGVITPTEESLLPWMYTQIKTARASNDGDSNVGIRMIYAGLEDGTFFGYYNDTTLTRRVGGDATAADYDWFPYDGEGCDGGGSGTVYDRVNAADLGQKLNGTYLCSIDDSSTWHAGASCDTQHDDFQPTVEMGFNLDDDDASCCCHKSIRTFYSTRPTLKGRANEVTGWKVYDPLIRTWYTGAKAQFREHHSTQGRTSCDGRCDSTSSCAHQQCNNGSNEVCANAGSDGTAASCDASDHDCSFNVQDAPRATSRWSSIYLFSTDHTIGITKTSTILDCNGDFAGVYAVDITLDRLSSLLQDAVGSRRTNINTPWAYIVERSGTNAGRLVASSDGQVNATVDGEPKRVLANSSTSYHIRTSARLLGELDGNFDKESNIVWVATMATISGLDWLLVVGQNTTCRPDQIWHAGTGTCKPCSEDEISVDGRCEPCDKVFFESEPNEATGSCVCPIEEGFPLCTGQIAFGRGTHLCPVKGSWFHIQANTMVDLIGCPFCEVGPRGGPCTAQSDRMPDTGADYTFSATCKENHKGFLCLECVDSHQWESATGHCVKCDSTNWWGLSLIIASLLGFGFYHLWAIFNGCCPPDIALAIFDSIVGAEGHMEGAVLRDRMQGEGSMRELVQRLGDTLGFNFTLQLGWQLHKLQTIAATIRGEPTWAAKTWNRIRTKCGMTGNEAGHAILSFPGEQPKDEAVVCDRVHFEAWILEQQSSDTIYMAVFFYQSLGVIMSAAGVPTWGSAAVGGESGACVIHWCGIWCPLFGPLIQLFVGPLAVLMLGAFILKRKASIQIERWHLFRGILQCYLYSFFPVTERAFEYLSCRQIPVPGISSDEALTKEGRLVNDMSRTCWNVEHNLMATVAIIILVLYIGALILLVFQVYQIEARRNIPLGEEEPTIPTAMLLSPGIFFMAVFIALGVGGRESNHWLWSLLIFAVFLAVLHVLRSKHMGRKNIGLRGILRSSYHPNTLRGTMDKLMPFGPLKDPAIAAEKGTLVEILDYGTQEDVDWWLCSLEHPDQTTGNAGAAKGYIPREHIEKAPVTNFSALFYLCYSVRPCKYWWFAFLHFVKLLISLIIIRGKADSEFEWKQWMTVLLCAAAIFSHVHHPYIRQQDNRMEQLMFLGLVCIIGIVQTARDFEQASFVDYLYSNTADFVLMLLVILTIVSGVIYGVFDEAANNVSIRESRLQTLQERNERLRDLYLRQLFTKALPQVLLLEKDRRRDVMRQFLREEIPEGRVIYSRGDAADMFYLVVEGQVTLRNESSGDELTLPNGSGLAYFGAGALLSEQDKPRTATAIATTRVTCLRIHRHDFLKTWATESAASVQRLFDGMDTDDSKRLERRELEERLCCHAAEDGIDIRSAVDSLMWILDDDEDGKISEAEVQHNLRATPPDDDDLLSGTVWAVRDRTTSEVVERIRTDTLTRQRRGSTEAGSQRNPQQDLRERRAVARRRAQLESLDEGSNSDSSEYYEVPPPPTPCTQDRAVPSGEVSPIDEDDEEATLSSSVTKHTRV